MFREKPFNAVLVLTLWVILQVLAGFIVGVSSHVCVLDGHEVDNATSYHCMCKPKQTGTAVCDFSESKKCGCDWNTSACEAPCTSCSSIKVPCDVYWARIQSVKLTRQGAASSTITPSTELLTWSTGQGTLSLPVTISNVGQGVWYVNMSSRLACDADYNDCVARNATGLFMWTDGTSNDVWPAGVTYCAKASGNSSQNRMQGNFYSLEMIAVSDSVSATLSIKLDHLACSGTGALPYCCPTPAPTPMPTPDPSPFPSPALPPGVIPPPNAVDVKLRLTGYSLSNLPSGSAARQSFIASLKADLALLMNVNANRLEVVELTSGSVIAQVRLLPSDNGDQKTSAVLSQELEQMVENPNSPLYTSDAVTVTPNADPSYFVSVASPTPSPTSSPESTRALGGPGTVVAVSAFVLVSIVGFVSVIALRRRRREGGVKEQAESIMLNPMQQTVQKEGVRRIDEPAQPSAGHTSSQANPRLSSGATGHTSSQANLMDFGVANEDHAGKHLSAPHFLGEPRASMDTTALSAVAAAHGDDVDASADIVENETGLKESSVVDIESDEDSGDGSCSEEHDSVSLSWPPASAVPEKQRVASQKLRQFLPNELLNVRDTQTSRKHGEEWTLPRLNAIHAANLALQTRAGSLSPRPSVSDVDVMASRRSSTNSWDSDANTAPEPYSFSPLESSVGTPSPDASPPQQSRSLSVSGNTYIACSNSQMPRVLRRISDGELLYVKDVFEQRGVRVRQAGLSGRTHSADSVESWPPWNE